MDCQGLKILVGLPVALMQLVRHIRTGRWQLTSLTFWFYHTPGQELNPDSASNFSRLKPNGYFMHQQV